MSRKSLRHSRMPIGVWLSCPMRSLGPRQRSLLLRLVGWCGRGQNGVIVTSRERIMAASRTSSHRQADADYRALVDAGLIVTTKHGHSGSARWSALTWLKPGTVFLIPANLERACIHRWGFPGGSPSLAPFVMLPIPDRSVVEDFFALSARAQCTLFDILAKWDYNNGAISWSSTDIRKSLGCTQRDARSAIQELLDGGWLLCTARRRGCRPNLYGLPWLVRGRFEVANFHQLFDFDQLDKLPAKFSPNYLIHRDC